VRPGNVVIALLAGARVTKLRPAVVLSSDRYHRQRPDAVVGILTTQAPIPVCETDHRLHDWRIAGLRAESWFRGAYPIGIGWRSKEGYV
jgi:mRNA interferase MazF